MSDQNDYNRRTQAISLSAAALALGALALSQVDRPNLVDSFKSEVLGASVTEATAFTPESLCTSTSNVQATLVQDGCVFSIPS